MTQIGAAIIGCGKVADTHARALATLPESRLVAAFDLNPERAAAIARRYGGQAYTDLDQMLSNPEVKMASICTPHPSHPEMVARCATAGIHALVEKPLAIDLAGADRAIAAADAAGIKLGVISQRRYYEPVVRVRQAIEAGKIGRPVLGTLTLLGWRDAAYYAMDAWRGRWDGEGGGVLVNQAVHQLDLFQWLMGPVAELTGYWANLNHPMIEVEDTAVAILRFRSGALGAIVLSNSQRPGLYGKLHIHGANGASVGVQTDGGSSFVSGVTSTVEAPYNDLWTVPGEEHLLAGWQAADRERGDEIDFMTHYHARQIRDFLIALLEDRDPPVTGREGRKAVEIIAAVYRSQRDGKPVRFPVDAAGGAADLDGRLSVSIPGREDRLGSSDIGGENDASAAF